MNKNFLIAAAFGCILSLFSENTNAQGVYLKVGGGYNLGAGSEIEYNKTTTGYGADAKTAFERVNYNLGKGMPLNLSLGFMVTEQVGLELGAGYLLGAPNEITESTQFEFRTDSKVEESYSRLILFQPSVVLSAGGKGIRPYARIGVTAASGKVTTIKTEYKNYEMEVTEREYTGGLALGFQGGVGLDMAITSSLGFFTEVTLSTLKYAPEKSKITKATKNGADVLGTYTTAEKEIIYSGNQEITSGADPTVSKPARGLKFNMPFSTVGAAVGFKFNL